MFSSDPEHGDDHDKKAAVHLPFVHTPGFVRGYGFVAEFVEPAAFKYKEEVKKPEAKEHIQAGKIGEKEGEDAEVSANRRELSVDPVPSSTINGKLRESRQEIANAVPGDDTKSDRKADPEETVAGKGRQPSFAVAGVGDHFNQGRNDREEKTFVFGPLLAKDDGDTAHDCEACHDGEEPPEEGQCPGIPGDVGARGHALVKPGHSIVVI